MTPQETALLLAYIQAADTRFQADEATLAVWQNCLPDDIPYQTALQLATTHYQTSHHPILPVNIISPYLASTRQSTAEEETERINNLPPHDCTNGWTYITETRPRYGTYEAVTPCPICHP